jgi:SAM-dependent methyltransferase
MEQPPTELGKFDLIVTSTVIHHVNNSEKLFEAFSQILLPGGWLVVAEWFKREGVYEKPVRLSKKGYDPDALTAQAARHFRGIHFTWKVVHFFKRDDGFEYPIFAAIGERRKQGL